MVYTDGIHLVADRLDELHRFAEDIGLRRCYFEGTRKGHPHYDLWTRAGNPVKVGIGATALYFTIYKSGMVKVVSTREVLALSKHMLYGRGRMTGRKKNPPVTPGDL